MKLMLISMFIIAHPVGVFDFSDTSFVGAFPARECREIASNLNAVALSRATKLSRGRIHWFCTELPEE